jgi:hypothetical protein
VDAALVTFDHISGATSGGKQGRDQTIADFERESRTPYDRTLADIQGRLRRQALNSQTADSRG